MTQEKKDKQRSSVGYGSTYTKGMQSDLKNNGIGNAAVLGGQVWMISPDKKAKDQNPCIWMQSGAVKFKSCNNYYNCTSCKYDLGMQTKVGKGNQISWQDAMRRRTSLGRICRHSLTHRMENRVCAYDYQCSTCDFDQYFEDILSSRIGSRPFEMNEIRGIQLPVGYSFHHGHTWARIESGGFIRVGLDDFSMKLFGKADGFDLPLMGKELDQGVPGWGIKRKDNLADVLSPIGGVITEVNPKVRENPETANREPFADGWLFTVRTPDIGSTMKKLMKDTESLDWMNAEINTLEEMIEDVAGPLTADGGYLTNDIFGALPQLGWSNLVRTFLKT
ncbi:MAG: glycine cleavage system protein H [Pseudomonadota bacterium]